MTEIKFTIIGRPKVQKNDLVIRKGKGGRPFVAHSNKLEKIREEMAQTCYEQYLSQGFSDPIDYLIEVEFKFYCTKQWEPDLDNLPAIVLDALQGKQVIRKKEKVRIYQVLIDDKLVKKEKSEKFVKGVDYDGEPRTEVWIRKYDAGLGTGCDASGDTVPSDDPS